MLKIIYIILNVIVLLLVNISVFMVVIYGADGTMQNEFGILPWIFLGIVNLFHIYSIFFVPGRLILFGRIYAIFFVIGLAYFLYTSFFATGGP